MASDVFHGPSGTYAVETRDRWYDSHDLAEVKRRAESMGDGVTPVIVLESGTLQPSEHAGVWIVPRVHLVRWLTGRTAALEQAS